MTPQGYDLLLREFHYLKEIEKPRINREKQRAAELGDRSENAEYHAAKEKLRHLDKRLFFLKRYIDHAQIIDPLKLGHSRVHFGSSVRLVDEHSDEEMEYTLCGSVESEPEHGLISIHSPLGRAVLGRRVGEECHVKLPSGIKEYTILSITCVGLFLLKQHHPDERSFGFH